MAICELQKRESTISKCPDILEEDLDHEICGDCGVLRSLEEMWCRYCRDITESCFSCRRLRFKCPKSSRDFRIATDLICTNGFEKIEKGGE